MTDSQTDLAQAIASATAGIGTPALKSATQSLIETYRGPSTTRATDVILRSTQRAAAYAAYRMPATFAVARTTLSRAAASLPDFQPRRHLDLGGGTGAAVWAAADVWPSLEEHLVVEQSKTAIAMGRKLLAKRGGPAINCNWVDDRLPSKLADADLITVGYLVNELPPAAQTELFEHLASANAVVAVLEPGSKEGYRNVLRYREIALEHNRSIVAPCPHTRACPMSVTEDWCHFPTRVVRSAQHQALKDASQNYEDEKFSYLVTSPAEVAIATNRIVAPVAKGKRLIRTTLCQPNGHLQAVIIPKSAASDYRAIRKLQWGDTYATFSEERGPEPNPM